MCFEILTPQLLVIINKSLFNGYFPIGWRKATVVPIPKVNIPEEIGDLRPIALTPSLTWENTRKICTHAIAWTSE